MLTVMPGTRIRRVSTAVVRAALVSVVLLAVSPGAALAQAPDWDVPAGHFFTQTGGTPGCGYLVRDEAGLPFWSEFRRLGGVQAVGYPASKRFQWDGFTVQVFQRVVFQWRPEAVSSTGGVGQAYFVNVFDRLGELGKNDYLLRARQTPPPRPFADAGKSWPEVVQSHLAVLEPFPAIKAKYHDAVGDAIQANGLPVSDVTDMGNHYALRAQRVVFQQWKEDVPWAKAGQVTVALGGDIAKETGVLPDSEALKATCAAQPGIQNTPGPVPGPADIQVSYRLDPWLVSGNYGGGFWGSPAVLGPATQGRPTFVVRARAQGLDAAGRPLTDFEWVPADPGMVRVSPGRGSEVTITVERAGQSTLHVTSGGSTRELVIKAESRGDAITVEIAQRPQPAAARPDAAAAAVAR
jgi:hypothetical protein